MSQDLTNVIPVLLAQGLVALRQRAIMPRLVSRAYELAPGIKGSTVNVPVPSAVPATAVSPSATLGGGTDMSPTSVPIACDQWYEAAFVLSDKEAMESMDGTIPMQASEAIKSLANTVDAYIWSFYRSFGGYTGTAGTTPFASDVTAFTTARKVMARRLVDNDPRYFVMDPDAEANALALAAFRDVAQSGDLGLISDGVIGRKYGATWLMSQNVPTHTAGTITTGLIAKAATAVAAGLKTFVAHDRSRHRRVRAAQGRHHRHRRAHEDLRAGGERHAGGGGNRRDPHHHRGAGEGAGRIPRPSRSRRATSSTSRSTAMRWRSPAVRWRAQPSASAASSRPWTRCRASSCGSKSSARTSARAGATTSSSAHSASALSSDAGWPASSPEGGAAAPPF